MRQAMRFVLPLAVLLAVLSLSASIVADRTSRSWSEKDVRLRAQLALAGARHAIIRSWQAGDTAAIGRVLGELARDERLMGALACSPELVTVARTVEYPDAFDCPAVGKRLRVRASAPPSEWSELSQLEELHGGSIHLSATPLAEEGRVLGFTVLVHDMSWADRRSAESRQFMFLVFAMLAAVAAAVTLLVARRSWRRWTEELRRVLRGGARRPEFQPLLKDVRELMASLAHEREEAPSGPAWGPARLKQTLRRHLSGDKVIICANREPYIHDRTADGQIKVLHPASGLVTALEPVMRACSGVWVAHGSGPADRDVVDRHNRVWVPPDERSYQIRRVWLSEAEEKGYYYGFANEGLWPLCHVAHTRPAFRSDDWAHYERVNRKFAEAVCAEADGDDPIVFVQDYHFAMAPRMIRERLPRATIITFWHIPWPNAERFGICPFREQLLEGLLGSSIVGFHTQYHCNNFLETIDRFLESRIDRESFAVVHGGQTTLVRPYPISIEWPNRWADTAPPVAECRRSVFSELGLRDGMMLGVGVDRLDYTKGIEERLLAVERLLERHPAFRGRFCFVQLAAPSRTAIPRYKDLNVAVEELAARINGRFGGPGYRPVILLRGHHEPPAVFRFFRAADLCYVSSLHDGMNLVAKEFCAARDDERGVLVLSSFTGAAREMTEALIVNPYDLDQASAALAAALTMPPEEQAARMHAMRSLVSHFNVYRWAGRMLIDAAQLRQRERLSGRLPDRVTFMEGTGT